MKPPGVAFIMVVVVLVLVVLMVVAVVEGQITHRKLLASAISCLRAVMVGSSLYFWLYVSSCGRDRGEDSEP
ncbi:hypothetical protein E2C01_079584 [Portunus trituberculatus]|uniref:Uncharacterized protein n=1 Tax=Portunus trituberculatus TaxID=210409 RepID=A0A5B7IXE3_PORTR|nr:hypothetical protein [Portunus trituberculatus]